MSEPLLVLEGVNKIYQSGQEELRVLKDLTVSVEASTITVVTGGKRLREKHASQPPGRP